MVEMIIFSLVMIFFIPFALKRMTRWTLVLPFFLVSFFIISNIGFLDQYSFIDGDLVFHKSLVDNLMDKQLFENDKAVQCFVKIYPKGYHFLLICLSYFKLSVPQISKLLGVILSFITPFLFYLLGKEIYQDNKAAFFRWLFLILG